MRNEQGLVARVRSSPRLQRRVIVGALALVLAGTLVAIALLFWNTSTFVEAPISEERADIAASAKSIPFGDDTRDVARRWILGAVTRRDLVSTFDLTHEDIRGSLTRAEWEEGAIPVIPYPVDEIGDKMWHVEYSLEDEAMVEVRLNPGADAPPGQRALTFFIGLVREGEGDEARWLVNYWAPRYRPGVPLAQ